MSEVKASTLRVREWRRKKKMEELSNMTSYNFIKYIESKLNSLYGREILGYGYSLTDNILEVSVSKNEDTSQYKTEERENYKNVLFYCDSPTDRIMCYEFIMKKIKRMKGR